MTDYTDEYEYEEGEFSELDAFLERLSDLRDEYEREPKVRMINPTKLKQFKDALYGLTQIANKTRGVKINYSLNDEMDIGAADIRIETDEFVVKDITQFISSIRFASNMDFYPVNNGKMHVDITFYGMFLE